MYISALGCLRKKNEDANIRSWFSKKDFPKKKRVAAVDILCTYVCTLGCETVEKSSKFGI